MAARTIMVIVDDGETYSGIGLLLEKRGHRVIEVVNDGQVLEKVKQERPDLILMDTDLPAARSLVFARGLRERARLHDVAIIVATTQKMPGVQGVSAAMGDNDYVIYQGDVEQLKNVLTRLSVEETTLMTTEVGSK